MPKTIRSHMVQQSQEQTDARIPAILDASVVALARELAQNILPAEEVLRIYGFDGPDDPRWEELCQSPEFKTLLNTQIKEWREADSTPKRVKTKALVAVEMLIPNMTMAASDPTLALSARVEAAKWLSSIAGLRDNTQQQVGATVSLTINMGGNQVTLTPTISGVAEQVSESAGDDPEQTPPVEDSTPVTTVLNQLQALDYPSSLRSSTAPKSPTTPTITALVNPSEEPLDIIAKALGPQMPKTV